ncbi:ABC transporter ATP-binding protein [Halomonas elongata]|uniref:ABC transporter ATP-binding protein n=1 Tax=Halomonas elongata (strain ATCC 33173 / DSM 2581 / NBRC 15536 / NCIMB 2198 / 1H9) TaxID=768066 RepID=E1V9R6_HALED|nr:ABC transporter ATP-binding protein [Halomonas elongata]MBW5798608.1 ABC transporter ATP-binding protein [Halomonas elongata]MDL4861964.1 ABC transporter ATP-binding protein [Halomonas elongata]WBF19143.1 ABC transporter ATP-binding protein [Halomonas elongata]WPU48002.1 ABC transporter ATP-binding protein [Halomonas elongata DSM 2581]WVI72644.1 ABC transporter ATP-binding protein [Halomonas elongata]
MAEPALSIRGLTKVYGNGFQALKGIDLDVAQGDFYALLGPNGAGKSTTLGVVCSLVQKTDGKVSVFGIDIDTDFARAKYHLGVVPQEFNFNQFEKVIDIVLAQAGYYGMSRREALPRAEQLLSDLGLWDKRNGSARMLSGGMKRRLMIARALMHRPRLLILDEPTAGVDIELRRSMWEYMRHINEVEGTTIILTTHYLEEAESLCRHVGIINHGRIVRDTSVRDLLAELNTETFLLDLAHPIEEAPSIDGFEVRQVDGAQLSVMVHRGQRLNDVFEALGEQGIEVMSMRNRANRLEEMFVSMVEEGQSPIDRDTEVRG